MTDKYAQVIEFLETPRLFRELLEHTQLSGSYLHKILAALVETEKITREKVQSERRNKFYLYTRLVDSVTHEEVISIAENKAHMRNSAKDINPLARQVYERHVPREKKKSPRVYVGCSFNQAGW